MWDINKEYRANDEVVMGAFKATCKVDHTSKGKSEESKYWRIWEMTEQLSGQCVATYIAAMAQGAKQERERVMGEMLTAIDEVIDMCKGLRDDAVKEAKSETARELLQTQGQVTVDVVDQVRAIAETVISGEDNAQD